MSRLRLLGVVGVVLLVTMVAAPSGNAATPITIQYWHGHTGPDGEVMGQLVREFMKENPDVKLEVTVVPWGELFTKAELAVAGGSGPDLVSMPLDRIVIYRDKVFKPIDDVIQGFETGAFDRDLWKATQLDGKQYGIPMDTHPYVLFYRKDLVAKAGLPPLPKAQPLTREQFLEYARKLTRPPDQYGFAFKQTAHHVWWDTWNFFLQFGGRLYSDDGRSFLINERAGIEAVDFLRGLREREKVTPPELVDWKAAISLFTAGKVAMFIHGSWTVPALDKAKVDYGTAMIPHVGPQQYGAWANVHMFAFPRLEPRRTEGAVKYARWFAKPENMARWGVVSGNVPAGLKAREIYAREEKYKALLATVERLQGRHFMTPYKTQAETIVYKFIVPALEGVFRGLTPTKDGLDRIAADATRELQR